MATTRSTATTTASTVGERAIPPLDPKFLPTPGKPILPWQNWIRLFQSHLVSCGLADPTDARKLALLHTSLGVEAYRVCSELCPEDLSYADTVQRLHAHYAPRPSRIYARTQFHRRSQRSYEDVQTFLAELRALMVDCQYDAAIERELLRDRFALEILMIVFVRDNPWRR